MTSEPKPTRKVLLDLIRERPGITREEMLAATGMASGKVDPSRQRLWLGGYIEPDSEAGWDAALNKRIKDVRWRAVDDAEQRLRVKERAAAREERTATSPEARARRIVEHMGDPTVRRLVEALMKSGAASPRSQRSVEHALRKKHVERRQQARQAARDRAADADFRRLLSDLWDARGAVGAIDSHLMQERARVANGEPRQIADHHWETALHDVREIIRSFGGMWQNVRDLGDPDEPCPACGASQIDDARHLRAFAIDGEVVDEDVMDAEVVT